MYNIKIHCSRRHTIMRVLIIFISSIIFSSACANSNFPERPITVVVPFAPGGATEAPIRFAAKYITETLGHTVIIENKPGGNSIIGATHVARANPDGYTLLYSSDSAVVLNPLLYNDLPYSV